MTDDLQSHRQCSKLNEFTPHKGPARWSTDYETKRLSHLSKVMQLVISRAKIPFPSQGFHCWQWLPVCAFNHVTMSPLAV